MVRKRRMEGKGRREGRKDGWKGEGRSAAMVRWFVWRQRRKEGGRKAELRQGGIEMKEEKERGIEWIKEEIKGE